MTYLAQWRAPGALFATTQQSWLRREGTSRKPRSTGQARIRTATGRFRRAANGRGIEHQDMPVDPPIAPVVRRTPGTREERHGSLATHRNSLGSNSIAVSPTLAAFVGNPMASAIAGNRPGRDPQIAAGV